MFILIHYSYTFGFTILSYQFQAKNSILANIVIFLND